MSKKRRSANRRAHRSERRRGNAAPEARSEPGDASISLVSGDEPTKAQKGASAAPVEHSTEARAARMSAKRRAHKRKTRARATAISLVIGVPLAVGLAFFAGFFEPHIGVEASNEGGVGRHVAQGQDLPQRNRPPSSGLHYPTRSNYSVSSTAIAAGNWIHNLEHGGIAILFRCGGTQECSEIASQVRSEVGDVAAPGAYGEVKIVGSPYQDMDTPFAAVAWRRTLPLEFLDSEQLLAFYDRYVDRGPENAS